MPQHYYLHIGTGKTDTTSIQSFLSANRDALRSRGVYYPRNRGWRFGHHELIQDQDNVRLPLEKQKKAWLRLIKEAARSGCEKVVVSSERLATLAQVEDIRQIRGILAGHRITVIYYIRRHDEFMPSSYNQMLRAGDIILTSEEYSEQHNRNYLEIINRWASVFGDESITVFPFEKKTLMPSLVHTFLRCIGEEMQADYREQADKNRSPHADVLEAMVAVTRVAGCGVFDPADLMEFNEFITGAPCSLVRPKGPFRIYSPRQQYELVARNKETYEEIARRFLGREDGVLFEAPLPASDVEEPDAAFSLSAESLFMILAAIQVKNNRRFDRLQNKMPQYAIWRRLKRIIGSVRT